MSTSRLNAGRHRWATLAILAILGTQGAASFGAVFSALYPFTTYPMYRPVHWEGDTLYRYQLVGLLDDGQEINLQPDHAKLRWAKNLRWERFHQNVVACIRGLQENPHDPCRNWLDTLREPSPQRHDGKLAGVRLEVIGTVVLRDGLEPVAMETLHVLYPQRFLAYPMEVRFVSVDSDGS